MAIMGGFSSIFYSLYLIDLFGYYIAGFLISVMSLSQFLLDFPTGSLSDYLGQRGVGVLAFFTLGIGYLLYGLAPQNLYWLFIPIMIFIGLGNALLSGVVQTWFSNNYYHLMSEDKDRGTYGAIVARVKSLWALFFGIFVIIGSYLAFKTSRNFAFEINGIFGILTSMCLFYLLREFYPIEKNKIRQSIGKKIRGYLMLSFESINALFNDKLLLTTIIGLLLIMGSIGNVFMRFLLIPILFEYTGNDSLVGLSQSSLFFVVAFNVFFISIVAKKFQKRYLPVFMAFYVILYLSGFIIVLALFPANNTLNIPALAIIMVLFLFFDSFIGEIAVNLYYRVFLDLIPSVYRNSILSLFTSLVAIESTMLYPIIGTIIEKFNLIGGIAFLDVLGRFGCVFLIRIFFSGRMKSHTSIS